MELHIRYDLFNGERTPLWTKNVKGIYKRDNLGGEVSSVCIHLHCACV